MNTLCLGHDCQIQREISRQRISDDISIFNSLVTKTLNGVIRVIQKECGNFFNDINDLEITTYHPTSQNQHLIVEDTKIQVCSVHDFDPNVPLEENYKNFVKRRASPKRKRAFMKSLKEKEELKIFRSNRPNETLDRIVRLHDLIYEIRDGKNFDLYVFQDSGFMRKNWGIPNLHTYLAQPCKWTDGEWLGDTKLCNELRALCAPRILI